MKHVRGIERISHVLGLIVGSSPLVCLVVVVTSFWAKMTWTAVRWLWGLW